jgi:predicted phosphoribosyltransferase
MHAAVAALRAAGARQIVVAVPIASRQAVETLKREVDRVVCPLQPEGVFMIGQFYEDFAPVSFVFAKGMLQQLESTKMHGSASAPTQTSDLPIQLDDARLAGTLTCPKGHAD